MEDKKQDRNVPEKQDRGEEQNRPYNNNDNTARALDQAEKDIENDAELSAHSPNDDLDEGETARLGEGENPIE